MFIQCVIGALLAAGSVLMPESPRLVDRSICDIRRRFLICYARWLVDNDKDDAGLQVLVDLHGGDPHDEIANAEYQEIKERVMAEVG